MPSLFFFVVIFFLVFVLFFLENFFLALRDQQEILLQNCNKIAGLCLETIGLKRLKSYIEMQKELVGSHSPHLARVMILI